MSAVREHFTVALKNAKCHHCPKVIKLTDGNTTGMWTHLETNHPSLHKNIVDKKRLKAKIEKSKSSSNVNLKSQVFCPTPEVPKKS